VAERGQILTISLAHSGTMAQEISEIWTASTLLQQILPQSDRLLTLHTANFTWVLHSTQQDNTR